MELQKAVLMVGMKAEQRVAKWASLTVVLMVEKMADS